MKLPVLKKNDSWETTWDKSKEESGELLKEIADRKEGKKNDKEILEETFDVIQMCIGILDKLQQEGLDIEEASYKHIGKMVSRGWKFEKILDIVED